jgi:DNA-binding LacI/PurR family transcriptional regulator
MGRVTLQTIADRLGVSRMTVSNAFSRPDQLSAELRDRILAVADELGYVGPDPTARALASGTTGTVGLLMSDTRHFELTDEVAMGFIAAISDELAPTGKALTLLSAAPREGIIPARDVAMDGALVYSCDTTSPAVGWLMRRRMPVVFVDQPPAPGITSINVDDRGGARAIAEHVLSLGHRRIGIVTSGFGGEYGVLDDPRAASLAYGESERMAGWLSALDEAGVTPTAVRIPHGDPLDIGIAGAEALFAAGDPPTAILAFSDAMARGVIQAVEDKGLSVPGDISVAGFDDNPIARRMRPALTTVRQDVDAKGREAMRALTTAIERAKSGGSTARAKHVLLETSLVVRESTAPVSGAGRK